MKEETDQCEINTHDRTVIIAAVRETAKDVRTLFKSIEENLNHYMHDVDEGYYTDCALKCRFCELHILHNILADFDTAFDMPYDPEYEKLKDSEEGSA